MVFRPFAIIVGLTLFLPFEDFLLKWLPVSDLAYSVARLGSEAAIYLLLGVVLFDRLWRRLAWRRTPIDFLLAAFVILALVSIVLNHGPLLGGLINLRTLLRYIALYYIVVNINLNERRARLLAVCVVFVGFIQAIVGMVQHFIYGGPTAFWLPRPSDLEVAGYERQFSVLTGGIERGAVIGTFGHPVAMALYLLVAGLILVAVIANRGTLRRGHGLGLSGVLVPIIFGILLTYSRGSLLAMMLGIVLVLFATQRRRFVFAILAIAIIVANIAFLAVVAGSLKLGTDFVKVRESYVNPFENLRLLISEEYMERAQGQRLWLLTEVGGAILRSGSWIGFGADEQFAKLKIVERAGAGISRLITYKAFEDVFWVAMLAYYGVIGVVLYVCILGRLWWCASWVTVRSQSAVLRSLGAAVGGLVVVSIPLTFLVRSFEFRTFAFYFWLLAGVIMSDYMRGRRRGRVGVTA